MTWLPQPSASLADVFPWPEVTTLRGLRRLDALAQRYGQRPSAMIGVADVYLAYCVDELCFTVGLFPEPEQKETVLYGVGA